MSRYPFLNHFIVANREDCLEASKNAYLDTGPLSVRFVLNCYCVQAMDYFNWCKLFSILFLTKVSSNPNAHLPWTLKLSLLQSSYDEVLRIYPFACCRVVVEAVWSMMTSNFVVRILNNALYRVNCLLSGCTDMLILCFRI